LIGILHSIIKARDLIVAVNPATNWKTYNRDKHGVARRLKY